MSGPTAFPASAIISGTIDQARLGTGSAGLGAKVLTDAQTYVAMASGIGGSTGSTDNRLLRSDGTGAATLQSTGITVDDSNNVSGVGSLSVYEESQSNIKIGNYYSIWLWYATGATFRLYDSTAGADRLRVDSAGNIGIGKVPTVKLDVNGSIIASLPGRFGLYTFATVPTASSYTNYQITISDRAARSAYSDGTNWRFSADDVIIS